MENMERVGAGVEELQAWSEETGTGRKEVKAWGWETTRSKTESAMTSSKTLLFLSTKKLTIEGMCETRSQGQDANKSNKVETSMEKLRKTVVFSFHLFFYLLLNNMRDWLVLPPSSAWTGSDDDEDDDATVLDKSDWLRAQQQRGKSTSWSSALLTLLGLAPVVADRTMIHKHRSSVGGTQDDRRSSASSVASASATSTSATSDHQHLPTNKTIVNTETTHIQHEIQWVHGGNHVFLTGEFDDWSVSVPMEKCARGLFKAIIPVHPSKEIEYKFVVDGDWCYAKDLPHRIDQHGNVNNVIYAQQ